MRNLSDVLNKMNAEIDEDLSKFTRENRAEVSKNVLEPLRNFVEAISLYLLMKDKGEPLNYNYDRIQEALRFIRNNPETFFLYKFHYMLQGSISHYYEDEEISERLMLKYYEYLIELKKYLRKYHGVNILKNIYKFQVYQDPKFLEYYEAITNVVDRIPIESGSLFYGNRYYVQKVNQILIKNDIYYEITLSAVNDFATKYDRMIVYSKVKIFENYAVNIKYVRKKATIFGKAMPINILTSWMVSVRPCEFENFMKLFGISEEIRTDSKEYSNLMSFITRHRISLVDLVKLDKEVYDYNKTKILEDVKKVKIFNCLDKCRDLIVSKAPGANILSCLLLRLNNNVIKDQRDYRQNSKLSNLYIHYGAISFDEMPYNTSLLGHPIRITDLFQCIDIEGHEHEFLARRLVSNVENESTLYTPIETLENFENIDDLIEKYNRTVYSGHPGRKIYKLHDNLYIQQYENDILTVINKFKDFSSSGVNNYCEDFKSWYEQEGKTKIDSEEKLNKLKTLFEKTKLALVYGPAGTGKTYFVNHIADFYKEKSILFLSQTNTAVNNLKNRIDDNNNFKFETIYQFINKEIRINYDILVIDECSIVSNEDMSGILTKIECDQIITVGDVYQIEAISFGNWFNLARYFVPNYCITDLSDTHRTNDEELLKLWKNVRTLQCDIQEAIDRNGFSSDLNDSIFEPESKDEIILCLNYDGLYGINNVNRFLQENNPNKPIYWDVWTFKIDDPILFNKTERFDGLVYNNMKGTIVGIEKDDLWIDFQVKINVDLTSELEFYHRNFEILSVKDGESIIKFRVTKIKTTDYDDEDADNIIPFQIAYATSIHKSQGLEYDSVKIVITHDVEEKISHNVFYTAITRTKRLLKIYWTPETEKATISRFKSSFNVRDAKLLANKYNLKFYTGNDIH